MDAPAVTPSKYINIYKRRNRRKRGKLIDQGGPSTAMNSPAILENNIDIDLNVEPEENMQQDHHVDVPQTQDPAEDSNAGMVTLQSYNTSESSTNACIHMVLNAVIIDFI